MTAAPRAAAPVMTRSLQGRCNLKADAAVLLISLPSCRDDDGADSDGVRCVHLPHCASLKRTYLLEYAARRLVLDKQLCVAADEGGLVVMCAPQVRALCSRYLADAECVLQSSEGAARDLADQLCSIVAEISFEDKQLREKLRAALKAYWIQLGGEVPANLVKQAIHHSGAPPVVDASVCLSHHLRSIHWVCHQDAAMHRRAHRAQPTWLNQQGPGRSQDGVADALPSLISLVCFCAAQALKLDDEKVSIVLELELLRTPRLAIGDINMCVLALCAQLPH